MNGIDTAVASLLTNRVDSLLNISPGSAATSQTGAADVGTAPGSAAPAAQPAPPSAQTALSAVALTLNAIASSGGTATPAVLGQTPIWPAAPALDIELASELLADAAAAGAAGATADSTSSAASSAASNATTNSAPNATANASSNAANASPSATGASAATSVAAAQVPVAALAAALEKAVAASGLFYEAHLADWLAGQRSPADLAREPQNSLLADAPPGSDGAARQRTASGGAQPNGADGSNARPIPSITTALAARFMAGEVLASSVADLSGEPAHAGLHSLAQPLVGDADPQQGAQQNPQSMAAVHPATVPLVRQQLDLLATGQFRWSGEAWPGARLDWTIEQDGDEWDRSGGGAASEDGQPWRTRLTLSLPTLGTVDADLTLTGARLAVRVQASPGGAARLASQGESFRQRLAAAGIELNGLSIREIGGGAPAAASAAAALDPQAAASAYARSASAGSAAGSTGSAGRSSAQPRDRFDWDI